MRGQWIGNYKSADNGILILNIDRKEDYFHGVCSVIPESKIIPITSITFSTKFNGDSFSTRTTDIVPINPITNKVTNWESIKNLYPKARISASLEITGKITSNEMFIKAILDDGTKFDGLLSKKDYTCISSVKGEEKTWEQYKKDFLEINGNKYLFRGQSEPWKLRSSFHRRQRYNLTRFMNEDVPLLLQQLSSNINHFFNLENDNEMGAFLSLIQHHGYPTPLLDWTYSPYVAAFFAFADIKKDYSGDDMARIYIFNAEQWKSDWEAIPIVDSYKLNFTVRDLLSIENPRMVPQQAASVVTNIDDIESYIIEKQEVNKCLYLSAVDIRKDCRNKIMKELRTMGITSGAMFPGIEGICKGIRESMFDK